MKVSLVVTTYDSPLFIRKAIGSILVQSRMPDEVIIADDGSGDETACIVQGFSEVFPVPVYHVWQEHMGFRAAKIRNEAIKKSSGDYIILLDGDCVINRHFISDHLSLAEKGCFIQGKRAHVNKKAVQGFSCYHANSFPELLKMAMTGSISNVHHLIRLPRFFVIKNRKLKGIKSCNMGFFKQDILAVNGFNEDFIGWGNEDSELANRFFKYGLVKKVSQFTAICFHLWHPTNKAITNGNRQLLETTIASREYYCKNGIFKKDQS